MICSFFRLRKLPRSARLGIAVNARNEGKDAFERLVELEIFKERDEFFCSVLPECFELFFGSLFDFSSGHFALGVALPHIEQTADEIAQIVRKVAVVATHEEVERELGVLPNIHLAGDEVAEGIRTKLFDEIERVDDLARALGHFIAGAKPPAVNEEVLGQIDVERFEHDRPINGVRWHKNVFTDHMIVSWPLFIEVVGAVSSSGDVVSQRIKPYVGNEVFIKR